MKRRSWSNEVGLAALEWCDIFDPEYRRTTWIAEEEWFTDVTSRQMDFPLSMIKGPASSPCLNCVGWQDMSLTVVRKIEGPPLILTVLGGRTRAHLDNSSQASSPYLNCIGWQDKPTVEQLLCRRCLMLHFMAVTIWTLWPPQSGQFTILMFPLWWSNIASSCSVLCIRDITLFWCCQTGLILVLLCHCHLVDRIEENNKMVIVGLGLVLSPTRLLPTMTLFSTIIRIYCRVQVKKV